jgi:hypothetical protein
MLKRIPKSDISIRPFKAYKEWDKLSASASVLLAESGDYTKTEKVDILFGHLSGSTYNKYSLYGQIKSTFYNGREDNPIERFGIKTNEFTIVTKAKERFLSGSATVISVPQNCVGDGIKRGSVILNDGTNEYLDDGYGNLSGQDVNIVLDTINFDNQQIAFYDISAGLISFEILELNLENNILNVKYNSETYTLILIKIDFEENVLEVDSIPFLDNIVDKIGNVFYNQGLIVLTNLTGFNTSSFDLNFKSTQTIYEHEYLLIVNQDEFNISQNPTAVVEIGKESSFITGSDNKIYKVITNPGIKYIRKKTELPNGEILDYTYSGSISSSITNTWVSGGFEQSYTMTSIDSTGSFLTPMITTIGLYDDDCQLVVVAKLPQPIKSEHDMPVNFIVRFDT